MLNECLPRAWVHFEPQEKYRIWDGGYTWTTRLSLGRRLSVKVISTLTFVTEDWWLHLCIQVVPKVPWNDPQPLGCRPGEVGESIYLLRKFVLIQAPDSVALSTSVVLSVSKDHLHLFSNFVHLSILLQDMICYSQVTVHKTEALRSDLPMTT